MSVEFLEETTVLKKRNQSGWVEATVDERLSCRDHGANVSLRDADGASRPQIESMTPVYKNHRITPRTGGEPVATSGTVFKSRFQPTKRR